MIGCPVSNPVAPRVLFFGMQGNFSAACLHALLAQRIEVCAVVMPATPLPESQPVTIQRREPPRTMRSLLPLAQSGSPIPLLHTAWSRDIAVWEAGHLAHPDTLAILAAYQPTVLCVACFSKRIPRAILGLPALGGLNIHPSLLPANRGPVPLFWTFREGHETTGVTIHLLTEQMDSGDILAQEVIRVRDGITYEQLELTCATHGGKLLASAVAALHTGRAKPRPQDEERSSYHSFPDEEDFVVEASSWSARHVYNFVRALSSWNTPITLQLADERLLVRDALSYSLERPVPLEEVRRVDERMVLCRSGWVRVLV